MPRPRHRFHAPGGHTLDRRLLPSAWIAPAAPSANEPLPDPESSPGTDPGSDAPITPPPIPVSGPIGPGTS
jgi:hypothetical protein